MIALLIIVPVYVLFIRDDDSSSPPSESALLRAAADPNKAAEVLLEEVGDPQQGITIRYPNGWSGDTVNQAVRVKSPDGGTIIAVTTGGPANRAPEVFKTTVQGIASSYEHAKVTLAKSDPARTVAGLPSAAGVVSGKLKKGGQNATTLVSVARGSRRAYIVSAIIPSSGGDIGVANLILDRGLTLSN